MTPHAKGWGKRLQDLKAVLESVGSRVMLYRDSVVKYHAKYVIADDGGFSNPDIRQILKDSPHLNGIADPKRSSAKITRILNPAATLTDSLQRFPTRAAGAFQNTAASPCPQPSNYATFSFPFPI
jgi:hypothetical protein